jgi:hypothetical protein
MDVQSEFAEQNAMADFCFHGPIITRNESRPDVVVSADITLRVNPTTGTGEIVISRVDGRSEVRGALAPDFIAAYAASFFAPTERITAMTRTGWARRITDHLLDRQPSNAEEIAAVEAEGWAVEMRQGEGEFDLPANFAPFNALIRSLGEYYLAVLEPIDET